MALVSAGPTLDEGACDLPGSADGSAHQAEGIEGTAHPLKLPRDAARWCPVSTGGARIVWPRHEQRQGHPHGRQGTVRIGRMDVAERRQHAAPARRTAV